VAAALALLVLSWGAWRAHTRAYVSLQVHDHAGRTRERLWRDASEARVLLHDSQRRLRAEALLEPPHSLPRWIGPAREAVDCRPSSDPEAWRHCLDAQSRWMAAWATHAERADVLIGTCRIDGLPVARRSRRDWLLWWVPLPHVGGSPLGDHVLELHVDSARCASATVP
jgi:hypothetical protein